MNKKKHVLFRHPPIEMDGVEKMILNLLNPFDRYKFDLTYIVGLHQDELRNKLPPLLDSVKTNTIKEDLSKLLIIKKCFFKSIKTGI